MEYMNLDKLGCATQVPVLFIAWASSQQPAFGHWVWRPLSSRAQIGTVFIKEEFVDTWNLENV